MSHMDWNLDWASRDLYQEAVTDWKPLKAAIHVCLSYFEDLASFWTQILHLPLGKHISQQNKRKQEAWKKFKWKGHIIRI